MNTFLKSWIFFRKINFLIHSESYIRYTQKRYKNLSHAIDTHYRVMIYKSNNIGIHQIFQWCVLYVYSTLSKFIFPISWLSLENHHSSAIVWLLFFIATYTQANRSASLECLVNVFLIKTYHYVVYLTCHGFFHAFSL